MDHFPLSSFLTMVVSPPRFLISICRMSDSGREKIFGAASAAGLLALAASVLFDHHNAPARPARTTAAISKRPNFTVLPPAPPHAHTRNDYQQREEQDGLVK